MRAWTYSSEDLDAIWEGSLWLVATAGLALGAGPAVALAAVVLAFFAQIAVTRELALLVLAALRGVGLAVWALYLPAELVLSLSLAIVIRAAWREPRLLLWAATAMAVLGLPCLLAQSGGKGEPPSLLLWLRLGAALLWVADAVRTQRTQPLLGARSSVALAALLIVGVGARELGWLWVLPAPRYASAAFEAARLGQQKRAATLLDAQICQHLDENARLPAERLLRWGTLLAPRRYHTAEGRLWRAEQLYQRDPRQAQAIVERARRHSTEHAFLAAASRADARFVSWLAEHYRGEQPNLAAQLRIRGIRPPASGDLRCVEVPQ